MPHGELVTMCSPLTNPKHKKCKTACPSILPRHSCRHACPLSLLKGLALQELNKSGEADDGSAQGQGPLDHHCVNGYFPVIRTLHAFPVGGSTLGANYPLLMLRRQVNPVSGGRQSPSRDEWEPNIVLDCLCQT